MTELNFDDDTYVADSDAVTADGESNRIKRLQGAFGILSCAYWIALVMMVPGPTTATWPRAVRDLIALVMFEGVGAWMTFEALRFSGWKACKWTALSMIVVIAVLIAKFWPLARPVDLAGASVAAIILYVAQHVAHRLDLGWVTDPLTGERHKVAFVSHGEKFVNVTTTEQRMIEEVELRRDRRFKLLWFTPLGWGLAYAAWWLSPHAGWVWSATFGFWAAFILLLCWAKPALTEILYLVSWQDMKGHRVTSRPPEKPGLADVASQKVHGDAGFADEDEAVRRLGGGN